MTNDAQRQPLLGPDSAAPMELNGLNGAPPPSPRCLLLCLMSSLPPTTPLLGCMPMVSYMVCSSMINISRKKNYHVVKCNSCNEVTAIRNAPQEGSMSGALATVHSFGRAAVRELLVQDLIVRGSSTLLNCVEFKL